MQDSTQARPRRFHIGKLAASIGVSALIIAALAAAVDWSVVWADFARVDIRYLGLFPVMFVVLHWARTERWLLLLPRGQKVSRRVLFDANLVGALAIAFLPVRAGEFVRPWMIRRRQAVPFSTGLASIVMERAFDFAVLLSLLGVAAYGISEVPDAVVIGARSVGALTICLLLGLVLCYLFPDRVSRILGTIIRRVLHRRNTRIADRLIQFVDSFVRGFTVISDVRKLLLIVAWSFAIWLFMALWFQAGLAACGLDPSFRTGLLITIMVAIAISAPATVGFIGTYQVGCVIALSILGGYTRETALAYSLLLYAVEILITVVGGLIALHAERLKIGELSRISSEQ